MIERLDREIDIQIRRFFLPMTNENPSLDTFVTSTAEVPPPRRVDFVLMLTDDPQCR